MKCKFCRGDDPIVDSGRWVVEIAKRAYRDDPVIAITYITDTLEDAVFLDINFCPMCGRDLRQVGDLK